MRSRNSKVILFGFIFLIFIILGFSLGYVSAEAKDNSLTNPSGNVCGTNGNGMRATVLGYAWFSSTKTGNWETDSYFYKLNGYEPVIVLQYDGTTGYYLVCWDFASDDGYDPLVGWVYKDRILLDSEVTPIAP